MRKLQPFDIVLRHHRKYQRARILFLGFSVLLTVGLPLWHLHALDIEGAGLAGDSRWASVARWLPSTPPPLLGAPTSVWVGFFELVDPLEGLATALMRGVSWNLLWTLLPGVALVLFLGRFFCGWACPYLPVLAASNAARWLLSRLGIPTADVKLPRVTSRVVLVGALVVIDPVRTTLAKEATLHLRVRPGTDGALALGLIHQVLTRRAPGAELRDKVHGLEELAKLAANYPLERVEQLTSVPRAQLERVVDLLLDDGPIGIWQGLGVEHHVSGVQTVRAITSLEVLCGRFDNADPRSLVSPNPSDFHEQMLPALYRMRTPNPAPPEISARAVGRDRFPLFERYNREAQGELLAEAMVKGTVRALILWGSNALITSSGTQELEAAAQRLELLVTIDPFFSASAQRSDVVLPASTFAESADVDADETSVAAKGMVPVQGSSKPDFTILTELAHACGLGQWFPWKSFAEAQRAPKVTWMQDDAQQPKPRPMRGGTLELRRAKPSSSAPCSPKQGSSRSPCGAHRSSNRRPSFPSGW